MLRFSPQVKLPWAWQRRPIGRAETIPKGGGDRLQRRAEGPKEEAKRAVPVS